MKLFGIAALTLTALLAAGCSRVTGTDRGDDLPAARQEVSLHGVLQAPGPGESGVQGRQDAWFVTDQNAWLDLQLDPEFEHLADPSFLGRGITLSGEILPSEPTPVGGLPQILHVTGYQLDP